MCFGPFDFESNEVQIDVLDLQITKQSCPYTVKGKDICFTIVATNNSDLDVFGVRFSDELDPGLEYITGTFKINGEFTTPLMADNTIQYRIDIPAGEDVQIKFCARLSRSGL